MSVLLKPAGIAVMMAISFALIVAAAAYNRNGPPMARFVLDECRFNTATPDLFGPDDTLTLRTVSHYLPTSDGTIGLPEALARSSNTSRERRVFVALEAAGPAVDQWKEQVPSAHIPLVIRDAWTRPGILDRRYVDADDVAIVPGILANGSTADQIRLDIRDQTITIAPSDLALIQNLPDQASGTCSPRYRVGLGYGPLRWPYIESVTLIQPKN